jgi:hypothetical protein
VIVVAYLDRLVRSLAVQRELLERVEDAGGTIVAVWTLARFVPIPLRAGSRRPFSARSMNTNAA